MSDGGLRIALAGYRGNPFSGGQGVYLRHLSRALVELGHEVTVFSGQPYPDLDARVRLEKLPSLDLYRQPDPFRVPALREFRDTIDMLEFAHMCTAGFPEPLTFSLRLLRRARKGPFPFDVVHDNQCLGYGMLSLARRLPVIATVHHAVTIDRRMQMQAAPTRRSRLSYHRWYGFAEMQHRVARRLERVITVSRAARRDIVDEMSLDPDRVLVVPNGVDAASFRPLDAVARHPARILTTASADAPLKGLPVLLEAVAKLRTEQECELVVIGKMRDESTLPAEIDRLGLQSAVSFRSELSEQQIVELYASATVAVVPSLYEGFSLPAVEAMSCGVPLVATTGGALPEVVGKDGDTGLLVPPGDAGALAAAIGRLLESPELHARVGDAGRRRVLDRFTWKRAAEQTVEAYRQVIAGC